MSNWEKKQAKIEGVIERENKRDKERANIKRKREKQKREKTNANEIGSKRISNFTVSCLKRNVPGSEIDSEG